MSAHASTIESNGTGGGDWNDSSTWSGGIIPTSTDNVIIKSGDIVKIKDSRIIGFTGSLMVDIGAELIIDGTIGGLLQNNGSMINSGVLTLIGGSAISSGSLFNSGSLTNSETITLIGGTGSNSANLSNSGQIINSGDIISNGSSGPFAGRFFNSGTVNNECGATITMNGGPGFGSSQLPNTGSINNSGTMTFNGGRFGSGNGSLNNFAIVINHNAIIFNPGQASNSGVLLGNPIIEDPIPCDAADIVVADNQGRLLRVSHSGSVTEIVTGLDKPFGVAIQSNGNIITTEASGRLLSVIPGVGFTVITDTGLGSPLGVDIDNDGNFIVVDNNGRLLKVTPSGTVTEIAPGEFSRGILDVMVDSNEDYIVTDGVGRILRVTSGSVSEITNGLSGLIGVEEDSNGDFIVVTSGQLLRISPDGNTITPISPIPGQPFGVAADFDDNFLVTDQTGNLFRIINGAPLLIADNLGQPVFLEVEPTNSPPNCDFTDEPVDISSFESGVIVTSSISTIIKNTDLPPFHKTVEIVLSGITDVDGDALSLNIDTISQDEPTSGLDVEDKSPDGFGVGTDTASIRVERDGSGDGRVYEVSFTADDGNGGMCSSSRLLGIPHDNNHDSVNSGQNYDSTQP
jgi:hypothetical protein